jgi:heptosyltransferase-2
LLVARFVGAVLSPPRGRPAHRMRVDSPKRIVVFCLPGIGDAILYTPALALLREAFPHAHITAVTMFRGAADVLHASPHLDEVDCFDFFRAGFWRGVRKIWALRRREFDLSILGFPANRFEYNVVNALVGRHWRAGHRYHRQRWRSLSFLNNIVVDETGTRHNVEENLELVRTICRRLGAPVPTAAPQLAAPLTGDDRRHGDRMLAERGVDGDGNDVLIGLHTYSSTFKNMHRKCWPREHFVELIRRLGEALPRARFLLFSGPSDRAVNAYIVAHTDARVSVIDEPNIRHALGALRHCRIFVSNDSALMHLAGALGVPVVALFGPTDPRRLHPWAAPHVIVRRDLPCMPCFEYSSRPLRCDAGGTYACLRDLTVDEVFGASHGLLAHLAEGSATATA